MKKRISARGGATAVAALALALTLTGCGGVEVGELVYNDGGTGNPEFLGDYLLVTSEVGTSHGVTCDPGKTGTYGTSAIYATEEALEQFAKEGGSCWDLAGKANEGSGLEREGVLSFFHQSESQHDGLEKCSLPGECLRVSGGWMAHIDAKPKTSDLQDLLRAYMEAAIETW